MRRSWSVLLAAAMALALALPAQADGELQVVSGPFPWQPMCPGAHGVSLATATTLKGGSMLPTGLPIAARTCATTTLGARQCVVMAKTATVYYTLDGVTTASSSHSQLAVGATLTLVGAAQIAATQFYSATGTLDVECYR